MRAENSLLKLLSAEGDGVASVLDDPLRYMRYDQDPLRGAQGAVARAHEGWTAAQAELATKHAALQKAQETLERVNVLSSSAWAGVTSSPDDACRAAIDLLSKSAVSGVTNASAEHSAAEEKERDAAREHQDAVRVLSEAQSEAEDKARADLARH